MHRFGIDNNTKKIRDLSDVAGKWSEDDCNEFMTNINAFDAGSRNFVGIDMKLELHILKLCAISDPCIRKYFFKKNNMGKLYNSSF